MSTTKHVTAMRSVPMLGDTTCPMRRTHMAPMYTEFPFPRKLFEKFIRENDGEDSKTRVSRYVCIIAEYWQLRYQAIVIVFRLLPRHNRGVAGGHGHSR